MPTIGKIDCLLPQRGALGQGACANYLFTALYRAFRLFATNGVCVEVARFNGLGSTAGDCDWPNGAKPYKSYAWFLFKFPATQQRAWDWYFHCQWSNNTGLGITNHPGSANSWWYENLAIQVARGIGSTATIWNGTTLANGADTKGSAPYWKIPSGGSRVAVLPRNNGPGGSWASGKESFVQLLRTDADSQQRLHIVTDGDAVAIMHAVGGNVHRFTYAGMIDDHGIANGVLLLSANHTIPAGVNGSWGVPTQQSEVDGGIDVGTQERQYGFDRLYTAAMNTATYPNKLWTPSRTLLFRVPVYCIESGYAGHAGLLRGGLVREASQVIYPTTTGDRLFAFFNDGNLNNPALALAWDGVSDPGVSTSPEGVEFVR